MAILAWDSASALLPDIATSFPIILFASAFSYLLCLSVYRLYFHPLASHPGPLLACLSQWPDVYHAWKGDKHSHFASLHARYGTVVRFAPNSLAINHPAALKAIYGHGANVRKSEWYHGFRAAPGAISTLLATDKAHHARKRRIMAQAFSDQAMKGLETYVMENVRTFVAKIEGHVDAVRQKDKQWTEKVDMGKWNNYLVFDIMGDLVFGRSFGTLGATPENRHAIHLLTRAARRNYTVSSLPFLYKSGLERFLPILRKLWLDRSQYLAFGKRQVLARTQPPTKTEDSKAKRKDIFALLLAARDPETGEGLPPAELWMEGNTLIVAGSDTSSTTLSATLAHVLHHPPVLSRLRAELRARFPSQEAIRPGPELNASSYLRACVDEAMRLSPAVPGLLPRTVLGGGLRIPGLDVVVPEGVDVGVCTYALQRHADYVRDPLSYVPERWLSPPNADLVPNTSSDSATPPASAKELGATHGVQRSDSGVSISSNPSARATWSANSDAEVHARARERLHSIFAPFSIGPRACLGKPLVHMEVGVALAKIIWRWEMRLVDTEEPETGRRAQKGGEEREGSREYEMRDWFLGSGEGPVVEFAVGDG